MRKSRSSGVFPLMESKKELDGDFNDRLGAPLASVPGVVRGTVDGPHLHRKLAVLLLFGLHKGKNSQGWFLSTQNFSNN